MQSLQAGTPSAAPQMSFYTINLLQGARCVSPLSSMSMSMSMDKSEWKRGKYALFTPKDGLALTCADLLCRIGRFTVPLWCFGRGIEMRLCGVFCVMPESSAVSMCQICLSGKKVPLSEGPTLRFDALLNINFNIYDFGVF